ncbi:hypothetical protein FACS1894179_07010 [Bacteroidia bacterium]|nr:hypothetical protein FACS1894179_07010 [Bacteroidia bacterium]
MNDDITRQDENKATDKPKLSVVSQTEFDELEAKNGRLYIIDIVFDEKERYQFIARRPKKQVMDAVAKNKADISKANEIMLKNTIVAGDLDLLDDGVIYARVLKEIGQIFKEGQSFLTKA